MFVFVIVIVIVIVIVAVLFDSFGEHGDEGLDVMFDVLEAVDEATVGSEG